MIRDGCGEEERSGAGVVEGAIDAADIGVGVSGEEGGVESGSVQDGALAAVSVDYEQLGRRVGKIVAQILKTNQMPADTSPVMFQGDKLMLNAESAKRLGVEFPEDVRSQAAEMVGR